MANSIKDWILEDEKVLEEKKEISFPQFKKPWIIRSIGAEERQSIQKEATRKQRNRKTGLTLSETDTDRLLDLMIEKAVVEPELTNAELQEHYKPAGNAAATCRKMLKAGQYVELGQEIQTLSGFDVDEAVEEVKN